MAFGERLQEVRKRSGLTQEEFAEQLQVSRQSVSRWESGRGYPEMEKIIFICNRYGVTMDELFKDEVPTPGEPPVEAPLLSARTLGSVELVWSVRPATSNCLRGRWITSRLLRCPR